MRTVLTILLLAAMAVGGWLAWALYVPVTPSSQKFVLLHAGYSTRRIAKELQDAGVIRNAGAFLIWRRLHHGRSLKAGEYLFERPANAVEIDERLVRGDIYVRTVVVPEGFTI
ncbi:MAG: endolytic transglycosylase MltG, partial [Terriglobales bacterium]